MWWGTIGNECGMPFAGMFMMPIFFFAMIGLIFYFFTRRVSTADSHQFCSASRRDEMLGELEDLKKEIKELKKDKQE